MADVARTGFRAAGGIVAAVRGKGPQGDPGGAGAAPKSQLTDAALARKVESEIFRDGSVPKGNIDVNAVGRVVYLRGQARSAAMVADLSVRAAAVAEVERVENLLQTPRTRQSKGRSPKGGSPTRGRQPSRRVNAEAPPAAPEAEPGPKELAAKGEGRRAASLGSTDPEVPPVNPKAEPSPKELAAKGQGRRVAPLGSSGPESDGRADTGPISPEPEPGEDVGT